MKGYVINSYIKSLDDLPALLVDTPEPKPKDGLSLLSGMDRADGEHRRSTSGDFSERVELLRRVADAREIVSLYLSKAL